jgi:predicted dehydrogenase
MPAPLPIVDRPIRMAVVGLGQIAELVLPTYAGSDDVEVIALCDIDMKRCDRWGATFPTAFRTTDLEQLLGVDADVVDVLVPTPIHGPVATRVLDAGFHVQVQKPVARSLEDADAMISAAAASGAFLRVLEDYLFYPPLVQLHDVVRSGELGAPTGVHMKIVGTGRGGWEVPAASYVWQFEQAEDGRGMLVFDHGWHQLAVAHRLFGPVRRIFAWIGSTQVAPDIAPTITVDAPSTLVWEHDNGVRGVLDITIAPDTYFRSDYYSCDERVEVTAARGFVRCNRVSSFGIQEPSVVVYAEGMTRSYHALDDRPPDAFERSTAHLVDLCRGRASETVMDAPTSRAVLHTLLTAIESARIGRPLEVAK